jgi:hypothetical protein
LHTSLDQLVRIRLLQELVQPLDLDDLSH